MILTLIFALQGLRASGVLPDQALFGSARPRPVPLSDHETSDT